jgi:hypothetical protein
VVKGKKCVWRKIPLRTPSTPLLSVGTILLLAMCFVFPHALLIKAEPKALAESWGIIVGVASYQHVDGLDYCDDDARSLYDQLAPLWGANHLTLLVDSSATKSAINNAITSWLAPKEDSDDTVLFFFSGHGGQDTDMPPIDERDHQDEYLCPYDSLTGSWTNDIRDDELDTWLGGLDAGKTIVMLDTCYSGGFINNMAMAAKAVDKVGPVHFSEMATEGSDGFAKDLSKNGRVILTASQENEESGEYDTLKHGLFAYYIIDALSKPEMTDVNGDHVVSAEEIFGYAAPRTVDYAARQDDIQHPQIYDGYPGELPVVIMAAMATVTIGASRGTPLMTVDGANYTCGQPLTFNWVANSVHTLMVSQQAYEKIDNGTLESLHPYPNHCIGNWTIFRAGASGVRVHFNYIHTERNYDHVYIFDAAGNQVMTYSGDITDLWSPWVTGNTLKIRFLSDNFNVGDGFVADCFELTNERHTFTAWSDGTQSASRTLIANGTQTLTANYKTEHYLAVNSPFGSTLGLGWYDDGATAYAALNLGAVDFLNGSRVAFSGWSGDASGLNFSASSPILMNAAKTATADWKTQHYLTATSTYGNVSGVGWYDQNAAAAATLAAGTLAAGTGTQNVFTGWSGSASGTGLTSTTVTMNSPKTVVANWKTQYLLSFATSPSAGGSTNPSGTSVWADANSALAISATSGVGYAFSNWTSTGSVAFSNSAAASTTATINEPATLTANFAMSSSLVTPTPTPTPTPTAIQSTNQTTSPKPIITNSPTPPVPETTYTGLLAVTLAATAIAVLLRKRRQPRAARVSV